MAIDDTSNNTAAEPEEPACDPNPSTGQSTIPPSDPEQIKNVKLLGYETLFVNDPFLRYQHAMENMNMSQLMIFRLKLQIF